MSERMKDERLAEIEKKLRKCGWSESIKGELTDDEALFVALKAERAKVAELESKFSSEYWDRVGVEIMQLKAKVAELRKENYDLMTISIPELQLDLKDAQATIRRLCEATDFDVLHDEGTLESHLAMKNAGLL